MTFVCPNGRAVRSSRDACALTVATIDDVARRFSAYRGRTTTRSSYPLALDCAVTGGADRELEPGGPGCPATSSAARQPSGSWNGSWSAVPSWRQAPQDDGGHRDRGGCDWRGRGWCVAVAVTWVMAARSGRRGPVLQCRADHARAAPVWVTWSKGPFAEYIFSSTLRASPRPPARTLRPAPRRPVADAEVGHHAQVTAEDHPGRHPRWC